MCCLKVSGPSIKSRLNTVSGTPAATSVEVGEGLPVVGMAGVAFSIASACAGLASLITL